MYNCRGLGMPWALCAVLFFTLLCLWTVQSRDQQGQERSTLEWQTQQDQHYAERQKQRERLSQEAKEAIKLRWIRNHQSVVEPVVKMTDSDIPVLNITHEIAIPTPVKPWTENDMQALQTAVGQLSIARLLTVPDTMPDFQTLTLQQRLFKSLFQYFDPILADGRIDVAIDPVYRDTWVLLMDLEKTLYPWLHLSWENSFQITKATAGRGIVMCVGNYQFKYAATAVRTIRQVLKSDLPIEIFYIRDNDLTPAKRRYLETEFVNVRTRPIVDVIDDRYTQFSGWSLKPYSIIASSFTEVILVDADVYFFKKPDLLFEDKGYLKTGSLFFLDRTLFPGWDVGHTWLRSFLPTKSSFVEKSRWWKVTSAHEQESGVVVINKKKSLLGLLSTCKMNDREERTKVSYKHSHGDKETFWIGYEMVQSPYSFIKSYGAVIGGLGDGGDASRVCGNQLHLDTDGQPLWWNGGLLRDKNKWPDRYLKFTHYAEGEDWDFETSCIKETDKIREFTADEQHLAQKYIELDAARRADEELLDKGLWKPRNL